MSRWDAVSDRDYEESYGDPLPRQARSAPHGMLVFTRKLSAIEAERIRQASNSGESPESIAERFDGKYERFAPQPGKPEDVA